MPRGILSVVLCLVAVFGKAGDECAAGLRAAWFREKISPEIGATIAGYEPHDVSVEKNDDLFLCGLCMDDGRDKVLILSFDLLGLDACVIRPMRRQAAALLGIPEANVLLTCTHCHEGPHTRQLTERVAGLRHDYALDGQPNGLNVPYVRKLQATVARTVGSLATNGIWCACRLGYHSTQVDENRNRRYTTVDNRASFIAHNRALHKLATGLADKELGTIALLDPESSTPLYVIGNYAAHPLDAHSPGLGGVRISADFPGFYRRFIRAETGAEAMFIQGAAGDLVTRHDELGLVAARKTGEALALASLESVIDIQRNQDRFVFSDPRVGGEIKTFRTKLRDCWAKVYGQDEVSLEVQGLALGDIAFVGVPGELVNELGLAIKWNSPFKRTFVAYCATDYFGYILPPNLQAAGGYEAKDQRFASRDTLKLVAAAADVLFDLRARLFPDSGSARDAYPDNLELPVVDLPRGLKGAKWDPGSKTAESRREETVRIENRFGSAEVALLGGRVLSWRPKGGEEVLFLPKRRFAAEGEWSHGGIGICSPWFGSADIPGAPLHGFAANTRFTLKSRTCLEERCEVVLGASLPPAEMELRIVLTDRLALSLTTANRGDRPFSYTEAFHPYLAVADRARATLSGLGEGVFSVACPMDRVFRSPNARVDVTDPVAGRTVRIEAEGTFEVDVFTTDAAAGAHANLAADERARVLCVEPCTRKADARPLAPGASRTISMTISVR